MAKELADGESGRATVTSMFARDSVYVLVSVVQLAAAALITPVMARILSESQFGTFSADVALEQALVAVFSLGMVGGAQRTYFQHGKKHAQQLLFISAALIAFLSAAAAGTASLWAPAVGFRDPTSSVRLVVAWGALAAATQVVIYGLRAIDRLPAFAIVTLLQSVFGQVAGLFLAFAGSRSADDVILGCTVLQAVSLLFSWAYFRPMLLQRSNMRVLGGIVRFSIALMPNAVAFFFINAVDRLMILRYLGDSEVARYQLAYNLGGLTVLLSTYFHQSWESRAFGTKDRLARLGMTAASRDQLLELFCYMTLAVAIGGPSALYVWAPHSYHTSGLIGVLLLLTLCAFPHSSALARGRVLMAEGRAIFMVYSTVTAAVVNVTFNLILIPRWGLNGAASSVLLCLIAMDVSLWVWSRSRAPLRRPSRRTIVRMGSSVVIVAAVYRLPQTDSWFWTRIGVGLVPTCMAVRTFIGFARNPLQVSKA